MTDRFSPTRFPAPHPAPAEPSPGRPRRKTDTLTAMRQLAREAAEAGEPLARIGRRLNIPRTTLARWAQEDGFRKQDIAARKAAAAREEAEADAVRRRAEEAARRTVLAEEEDMPRSPAEEEIVLARARVGALLEAGLIPEAEADMRAARKLTSLAGFAGPVRKATYAAGRRLERDETNAALYRAALLVCGCWQEGDTAPDHLPWVVSGMFQKRLAFARQFLPLVMEEVADASDEDLTNVALMLAETGWFENYAGAMRDLLPRLREMGEGDLAARIEEDLQDEAEALPELLAWCEAHGYVWQGEV